MKRRTPTNKPCDHAGTGIDKDATNLDAVGQDSNVQWSTPDLVATIQVFPVLDHLLDGEHVILADSAEKSGCCLNVGGFAPFAFVNRVKTPGNTLSAGIFLDKPAEVINKLLSQITRKGRLHARNAATNIRLVLLVLQIMIFFVLGLWTKL